MQRIDYGDGEFPSIWPSEIDQDRIREYDFILLQPTVGYEALVQKIDTENKRREADALIKSLTPENEFDENGDSVWQGYIEANTGEKCYYNHMTQYISKVRPNNFYTPRTEVVHEWVHVHENNSESYYQDNATGHSTYRRPSEYITPRTEPEMAVELVAKEVLIPTYDEDEQGNKIIFKTIHDPHKPISFDPSISDGLNIANQSKSHTSRTMSPKHQLRKKIKKRKK